MLSTRGDRDDFFAWEEKKNLSRRGRGEVPQRTRRSAAENAEKCRRERGEVPDLFRLNHSHLVCGCAIVTCMAFSRPKKKSYSEVELYEYAVGALGRRMRTVAELKRLMRARVEEAESEYGQTLIELVIRRLN